ncbi:MAG: hypothetical protein IPM42_11765 [Saprospiraceae bacterium]|nr:hypothetical protein [Saprospiraceae bacterium]
MDKEIKNNKTKGLFGIGLSILFVMLGVYLLTEFPKNNLNLNPLLVKGIGIACILFFGAIFILGMRKLLK